MRNKRLAVFAVVMSLMLAACGSSSSTSGESNSTEVHSGGDIIDLQTFAAGEPDHIDPALATDVQGQQIARLLYEGLTVTDNHGQVQNAIALKVTPSEDAKTWTFLLRDDAKWEDGTVIEPSDFKFAWERALDPKLESRIAPGRMSIIQGASDVADGKTKAISGVVADDNSNTLTISLNTPFQELPSVLSTVLFVPLPAKLFAADPSLSAKWEQEKMMGNGPFKMAGPWEHNRSIKLLKSETYYGGFDNVSAAVASVDFRVSKDLDSQYNDFQTQSTSVGRVPPGQYESAVGKYGNGLLSTSILSTEYWGFNLKDPSVGGPENVKLRQAIGLAIDKKDIVAKLYGPARHPATGWAPPNIPGYQPSGVDASRNVERAKDLLREWGKTPPQIKVSFNAGAGHEEKAAIIVQNLNDIGIKASVDPIPQADWGRLFNTNKLQFFRGGWFADFVSYDNFVAPQFASPPVGTDNVFGYSNSTVDDLVSRARTTADAMERNIFYAQAERQALSDQVLIPLNWAGPGIVATSNIKELRVDPLGFVDYRHAWIRR